MATKGYISTKGFEAYLAEIAEAGQNVDEAASEAVLTGSEVLKDGMQRRVPKGETLNLHDNIKIKGPIQDGNFIYAEIGLVDADEETARYGNAQEYGTSSMAAQPYIRPTNREDSAAAKAAMRKSLKARGTI